MSNNGMVIDQSEDYTLEVGKSRETDIICYLLINRITGVVEVETSILPQALKFLMDLQAGLDGMRASKKEEEALINDDNLGNVVDINKKKE